MPRTTQIIEIPSLRRLNTSDGRLSVQLARSLREAILNKELAPGDRIPSTRSLALSLEVSRGTVQNCYDQLISEGWLVSKVGSGTHIAETTDAANFASFERSSTEESIPITIPPSAEKYAIFGSKLTSLPGIPFGIAVPNGEIALDRHWHKLSNRVRSSSEAAPTTYSDPKGLLKLRQAIASHLLKTRAVKCSPENIIITEGSQQGLYIAVQILLQAGDVAWTEDPAYPGLSLVLEERGVIQQQLRVDEQGFNPNLAINSNLPAKVAFVTPSHQYPLGMTMSMARRTALIDWARKCGGWIVEDDYDSELRYSGQPYPSIQGMEPNRVVYIGTFSKILASSLRLGYAIVPDCLANSFAGARAILGRSAAMTEQHIVAAYINEGYFQAHIRRIRDAYAAKRNTLIEALTKKLPQLSIQPSDQGMHIILWLPDHVSDLAISQSAMESGLVVRPVSPMCSEKNRVSGLILGFGGFTDAELLSSVANLANLIENYPRN